MPTPTAVVILPTSTYRATDFLSAAQEAGIDLIVASEQPPPIDMGDRYVQIDCSNPEKAAEAIASLGNRAPIDGVVAADDPGVEVAALTAQLLGLRGNNPDAARATRDKLAMRKALAGAEVDQPAFMALPPGADAAEAARFLGTPVVLKPRDRSASQGVIRVNHPDDARAAADQIRDIVGRDVTLVVETYMEGSEVAVEGLISDGELRVLAVFDKPDTADGPYFPETIFVTPSRLDQASLSEVERVAAAAVRGLGLSSGPVHVELRVDGRRARVIEVAARSIGGLCSRSLNFGLMGTSLETLILRNALDIERPLRREPVASGVLMIPAPAGGVFSAIAGEHEARAIPGITGIDLTVVPGDLISAPPHSDSYIGFVYARASQPDQVENALRTAMSKLEVQLEG